MIGWCKLLKETEDILEISYSFETDRSCDGLLTYNKKNKEISIQKLPAFREWMIDLFVCPLRSRIRKGLTEGKLDMIMTG